MWNMEDGRGGGKGGGLCEHTQEINDLRILQMIVNPWVERRKLVKTFIQSYNKEISFH